MPYRVLLVEDAERDIEDIYNYIARQDSPQAAEHVLGAIEAGIQQLSNMPERGNIPKELVRLGIREFREIHFKPYRTIYRIIGSDVFVLCVADGRRDMQSLLERRLLR